MDFEYEGAEDFGGRILWPRIAVFVFAAFLMLLLGRCTAGGGVPQAEFDAVVEQNSEAQTALAQKDVSIAQLQQDLIDARESAPAPTDPTAPGTTPGTDAADGTTTPPADGGGATTDAAGNRTYEVQPGDTLSTIAEAVYGDPRAFGAIAEANNLGGNNVLQVGDTLIIPANPDAQ
jgi:nucleoid-associated protein YgaU